MGKRPKGGLYVEKRAQGKWWAASEPNTGKNEYRGPFDTQGEAEAALLDLVRLSIDIVWRGEGPKDPQAEHWWVELWMLDKLHDPVVGPLERLGAELVAKQALQEMREMLGLRPTADARVDHGHVMEGMITFDHGQENATKPRNLSERPPDFAARLERAAALNARATELGADDLDLLLAAWQRLDPAGLTHRTLFLMHARAVIEWLARPEGEPIELHKLEDQIRTIGATIASHIERGMEFVFLLCNRGQGPSAFFTHVSSLDRATTVRLVGEYVDRLRGVQQRTQ